MAARQPLSDDAPPKLEPKHLFEKRMSRDKARLRAYNQLLEQIHHRIFTTSQLPGNANYIVYTVPPFILGVPHIDLEDCIVYIVYQLRTSGFEVRFTYPNLLWISWKNYEQEYLMKQNPIVKAMTPPPPPAQNTSKKGAGGNRGGPGQKSRVSFASTAEPKAEPAATTARSAAEYKPPQSFVTSMQTPQHQPRPGATGAGNVLADLWNFT
jgi:hypothetical protein